MGQMKISVANVRRSSSAQLRRRGLGVAAFVVESGPAVEFDAGLEGTIEVRQRCAGPKTPK